MKKQPYLPRREGDRVTWLNNFAGKLGGYAATFGIAPAVVNAVKAYALFYAYIIGLQEALKTFKQDLTQFKNLLSAAPAGTTLGALPAFSPGVAPPTTAAGIFTIISGIVAGIKSQTGVYTSTIGEDLGIEGDDHIFNPDDYKTTLKASVTVDGVKIEFAKGDADGVHIYSRIGQTGSFIFLATDTESPYIDNRPLTTPGTPEVREYYAIGFMHDHEIGQVSATVKATAG